MASGPVVLGLADEFLELAHVPRRAHEGKRDVIHPQFQAELDVRDVLFRQRGQADLDAGEVDVAAAAELAVGEDLALHLVAALGEHLHLDGAVVHQHHVVHLDVIHEFGVVDVHGIDLLALGAADGEGEFLAGRELQAARAGRRCGWRGPGCP